MKSNPLVANLAAGRAQIGTWVQLVRNPAVLTLLKSAGLDFVRFEMEHSSASIETVADMAVVARALDLPLLVRPPAGNREWITRLLDVGCWGLQVPQVDTPAIAREVVAAARYAPLGTRGMGGLGPHIDFAPAADLAEQLRELNAQVHITAMLESAESFRHLDEIVAMPGIDAYSIGPTDLAQDLGILGAPGWRNAIDEYRERMVAACMRHGKQPTFTVQSLEEGRRWLAAGVRFLAFGSDASMLHQGFGATARELRAEGVA